MAVRVGRPLLIFCAWRGGALGGLVRLPKRVSGYFGRAMKISRRCAEFPRCPMEWLRQVMTLSNFPRKRSRVLRERNGELYCSDAKNVVAPENDAPTWSAFVRSPITGPLSGILSCQGEYDVGALLSPVCALSLSPLGILTCRARCGKWRSCTRSRLRTLVASRYMLCSFSASSSKPVRTPEVTFGVSFRGALIVRGAFCRRAAQIVV